jgi:UDP-N-acetylmuramoylalanine--D-glutamate ligase
VLEHGGVRYINDSKATNTHAATASLSSFESVVWILGGQLKGVDISGLIGKFAKRLRSAVVIGVNRQEILEHFAALAPAVPVVEVGDGENVMERAVEFAYRSAAAGDVVLLAPAAASMDQFESYQDRGMKFKEAVVRIVGGSNA